MSRLFGKKFKRCRTCGHMYELDPASPRINCPVCRTRLPLNEIVKILRDGKGGTKR